MGDIYIGAVPLVTPSLAKNFRLLSRADEVRKLGVRANADNWLMQSQEFGVEGIVAGRAMFMEQDRCPLFQDDPQSLEERKKLSKTAALQGRF